MSAPEQAPINFKNRILQHAFLQALMQRGYMPEHDAKEMYKRIANTDNGKTPYNSSLPHPFCRSRS